MCKTGHGNEQGTKRISGGNIPFKQKITKFELNIPIMRTTGLLILLSLLLYSSKGNAQQSADAAFSKSYAFEYDTQYTKAIAALTDLNADTYECNLRLGWLHYLNKDYVKSETYYKKAVAQEAGSVEARFGLALPLSAMGNWNDVLSTYMEIIRLDPNNSIANYRIASIYYNRKDYANATTYITRVIKMYPFDYDSNLLYGQMLMAQGKNSEAKKYILKALEYNPQSEEAIAAMKKL